MKTNFNQLREIALGFPDVEEGTTYGSPAFKVGGRVFACLATHKSAEPETLVVRMDFEQRDELIAADPDVYYLKDHYVGYPCVLVRLLRVQPDALRDLLGGARRFVIAEKSRGSRAPAAGKRRQARPR
jgi:hypothetical protein